MKNSFKVGLLALVFSIGIAGAFANQSAHKFRINDPTDTWQDTNTNGSLKLTSNGGQTYADAQAAIDATGCNTVVATKCAASVTAPNGTETGSFIYRH
jgi:hypothetical protein